MDPGIYLTDTPQKIRRQRIDDNLLGSLDFSRWFARKILIW